MIRHNLLQLLIALDQTLNVLLGTILLPHEKSFADETLSSRCWRWSKDGKRDWPRRVVDWLFFLEAEHCKSSYESERLGRQLPPELRKRTERSGIC
jgi:hypothetical protein